MRTRGLREPWSVSVSRCQTAQCSSFPRRVLALGFVRLRHICLRFRLPRRRFAPRPRRTSMSEVANPYTINSLRSQYRTHVVSNLPAQRMPVTKRASLLAAPALHACHGNQLGHIIRCGVVACQRRSHDQLVVQRAEADMRLRVHGRSPGESPLA